MQQQVLRLAHGMVNMIHNQDQSYGRTQLMLGHRRAHRRYRCGEHRGDPSSVEFCHKIGLDYVSCSPFRVPIARLAAAQAAIADK